MNLIKHVWKHLKVLVYKHPVCPQNADELWIALQKEWLKIDLGFINSLIESMSCWVQAVYDAYGGSTEY